MEWIAVALLNGVSYGLLLFLLCAGLTLVFSLMGVMNFAHASFYMLGAYVGYTIARHGGFVAALALAPVAVAGLAAAFELAVMRRVHRHGMLAQLLATFGLAYLIAEVVQIGWGRSPLPVGVPPWLDGPLVSWHGIGFPRFRAFMMAMSTGVLAVCAWLLRYSRIGLVIAAARTHLDAVQALGYDVARVRTLVFACGAALAALAGVIGGAAFVTDTSMAETLGSVVFVIVVIGGMGSLMGAFVASLMIGVMQTLIITVDAPIDALVRWAFPVTAEAGAWSRITLAQLAPVLPFLLLIAVLTLRPGGLVRGYAERDE